MALSLPPWLTPSDPAPAAARGFQLGLHAGAQQASQRFQQMQMARMEQQDAMQQARWDAEMGIKAAEMARRHQAQMAYRQAIEGGMDPLDAMIRFGPEMGQQASAEAAAIRAMSQKPVTWSEKSTTTGAPYMLSSTGHLQFIPKTSTDQAFTPGDVKGYNVLDPETGKPMPEFVGVPSPSGKGMTTLQRHSSDALSAAQRENLLSRYQDRLLQLKRDNPGVDLSEGAKLPETKNPMLLREAQDALDMAGQIRTKIRELKAGRTSAKGTTRYEWNPQTGKLEKVGELGTAPMSFDEMDLEGVPEDATEEDLGDLMRTDLSTF